MVFGNLFETDKQKNVFFLRVFRGCSPQQIAACLGITDRNVRDLTDKMVAKIQKGLFDLLTKRQEDKVPLTSRETEFMNTYNAKRWGEKMRFTEPFGKAKARWIKYSDTVYLPKNRHIRKESMSSKDYAKIFFPFEKAVNENPNPHKVYPNNEVMS